MINFFRTKRNDTDDNDQAGRLRELVRTAAEPEETIETDLQDNHLGEEEFAGTVSVPLPSVQTLPLVLIIGSKGGVGTSSIALQLAEALRQLEQSPVAIDADPHRNDFSTLANLPPSDGPDLGDILLGSAEVNETLCQTPTGLKVIPSGWMLPTTAETWRPLPQQLATLESTDLLIADGGNNLTPATFELWRAASLVLLVTTPDKIAIRNAYATVKLGNQETQSSLRVADSTPVRIVINHAENEPAARQIYRGLRDTCQKFIDFTPGWGGWLSNVPAMPSLNEPPPLMRPIARRVLDSLAATATSQGETTTTEREAIAA